MATSNEPSTTDIGDLWLEALQTHEEKTGLELKRNVALLQKIKLSWSPTSSGGASAPDAGNAAKSAAPAQGGVAQSQAPMTADGIADYLIINLTVFQGVRNSSSKMGKVRHFLVEYAVGVGKIARFVGDAAGAAYPPAPVLMAAFAHLVGACAAVSEDLDSIEKLYDIMSTFLERVALLEGKLPPERLYRKMIMEVFCALLAFCTRTHLHLKKGRYRLKLWVQALVRGEDPKLKAAYDHVVGCISNLDSATIMQTLATVVNLDAKTGQGLDSVKAAIDRGISALSSTLAAQIDSSLEAFEDRQGQRKSESYVPVETPPSGQSKTLAMAARQIPILEHIIHRIEEIDRSHLEHSFSWLPPGVYSKIEAADRAVLLIEGDSGTGKTTLAFSIYCNLVAKFEEDPATSVMYFPLDWNVTGFRGLQEVLKLLLAQVAATDPSFMLYLEGRADQSSWEKKPWETAVGGYFSNSPRRAFIILDGVEQLIYDDIKKLAGHIEYTSAHGGRVVFILTSAFSAFTAPNIPGLSVELVELERSMIHGDIRRLAQDRLSAAPNLSRLHASVKTQILDELERKADSFTYAESMIRRLDELGSTSLVVKSLAKAPSSTVELYDTLLDECRRRYSAEDRTALAYLLAWVASSPADISLPAAQRLVSEILNNVSFDVGEEISTGLSKILKVTDRTEMDLSNGLEEGYSVNPAHLKAIISFQERFMRGQLQQRAIFGSVLDIPLRSKLAMMLELHLKILTAPLSNSYKFDNDEDGVTEIELIASAAKAWRSELIELSACPARHTGIPEIVRLLRDLLTNKNGALKKIEVYIDEEDSEDDPAFYSIFGVNNDEVELVLSALASLARYARLGPKDNESASESLPNDLAEWTKSTLENKTELMTTIARHHIENWFSMRVNSEVLTSFRCARNALLAARAHAQTTEAEPLQKELADFPDYDPEDGEVWEETETVLATARFGKDGPLSAREYLTVARTLEQVMDEPAAIKYARMGLLEDADRLTRFELNIQIAESRYNIWQDKFEDAYGLGFVDLGESKIQKRRTIKSDLRELWGVIGAINEALKVLPEAKHVDGFIKGELCFTYQRRARLEMLLPGMRSSVLLSMSMAIQNKASVSEILILDELVEGFAQSEMWGEIIQLLRILKDQKRLYDCKEVTKKHFLRAALATGEGEFLREVCQNYSEKEYLGSVARALAFTDLSHVHRFACKNPSVAQEQSSRVLRIKLVTPAQFSFTTSQISDIKLEDFRSASLIDDKLRVMNDLEQLVERVRARYGAIFDRGMWMWQIAIPLVRMQVKMGPIQKVYTELQAMFDACLSHLQGKDFCNEPLTLRKLATVLSLCPNSLKGQAAIALSCQFYYVREKAPLALDVEDRSEEESGHADSLEESSEEGPEDSTMRDSDIISEGTDAKSDDSAPPSSDTLDSDAAWNEFYAPCVSCSVEFGDWQENMYLCYCCTCTDLCEECYKKRRSQHRAAEAGVELKTLEVPPLDEVLAMLRRRSDKTDKARPIDTLSTRQLLYTRIPPIINREESPMRASQSPAPPTRVLDLEQESESEYEPRHSPKFEEGERDPSYLDLCPAGHHHIKGPATDWDGVYNGVIRLKKPSPHIGGKSEIQFTEWLELLRTQWNDAWERYWID